MHYEEEEEEKLAAQLCASVLLRLFSIQKYSTFDHYENEKKTNKQNEERSNFLAIAKKNK